MKSSIAALVPCVAALALPCAAQTLLRSINGPGAGAQFGSASIRVPDENNDGYDEVLVGAPGFNANRGAIYCVSGAYLATGTGPQTLWTLQPAANTDDQFGFALTAAGDLTGDGVVDFIVGEPGWDETTGNDNVGAVCLVNGATHTISARCHVSTVDGRFGSAVADCGDSTGDGLHEFAIGSVDPSFTTSVVRLVSGANLINSGLINSPLFTNAVPGGPAFGIQFASADVDGDGDDDLVLGVPAVFSSAGGCILWKRVGSTFSLAAQYSSTIAGEQLGTSVDASRDFDGDGVLDIVLGAPKSPGPLNTEPGRVVVLSGARWLANTPPFELYTIPGASGSVTPISSHFGAAVRACDDLNGDGVADFLVGAPDFFTSFPIGPGKGAVSIFSGKTGASIGGLVGSSNDHLGGALCGTLGDLDGDGFPEFAAAGPLSDVAGTDSGVLRTYRLFPVGPSIYCTAKLNSLGCTPAISFSGSPSVTSAAPFAITASNVLNQKNGVLFYSHSPIATAFQGGFKCAQNPTVRTPPQSSGGATSGSDCSGVYSFDFNAWMVNGWDTTLDIGSEVFAQYWSRDPASASHTGLSNAVRFVINP